MPATDQTTDQTTDHLFETDDLQLTSNDIGQLQNAAEIERFFARLGYNVDDAAPLGHAALGLEAEDLALQIKILRRIGADCDFGDIVIYLLVVKSVTMGLVQRIARQFRTRPELALLVLTVDYEKLDFVLLDRVQEKREPKSRLEVNFKQIIRPRSLTVERQHPNALALRVLRRFTYTEGDPDLQWEKLRSAYTLAEWSEEYFNNRALFSDYYLKQRLTDKTLTPAWAEDVTPIGRELFKPVSTARQSFGGHSETQLRRDFYEPFFKLLGFDFVAVKSGDSDSAAPDYYLYAPGERTQPLAAALTYVWNRNLDMPDEQRDTDTSAEIPGALVVSVLEGGQAPWVIATNGKLWRLYAAAADNKATNYYEVDLEEAFAAQDRVTALKYWWLFFRRAAFSGFLDEVRRSSADYAKELGQRLKNRVFEEIFPHFAAGLIENMRAAGQPVDLPQVFGATLTFLYRLMFVAYAESLDLLPLYEARGYGDVSLHKLKLAVAAAGGNVEDEAPKKLAKAYDTSATELYARLQVLFAAIDAGDPTRNVPTYNGGLFSAETAEGRLLARFAIPDRHLALGLDRLCRDVDKKTQALVQIDFKSLGVRQLGSIYEGLLEFKLQTAAQKLAVVREGGKEVYIPAAKAKGKNVLATLSQGDVYLQNDKAERKATGSYYTPDYIVKYIVEHTVGPVLQRKFEELAPKLHATQKNYRSARKVAEQKKEDPEKFWNSDAMRQLADACLDVKVLDPAMGSGHFLVEAVDFISDRLIVWLNAWSENPVWALLERTRGDILADMERQGVTIPAERLVRVALLKRAVLKRCIYGVDLNAMAVELAKVSLWLDAFTLGAPLSFLDHHLKQGNSLIGSRVAEVQTALQGAKASLFASSQFAGVMLATDLMRQVSYQSDNTPAQVAASRDAYRSAGDHLAPFKRVLDVYTSRWFGNGPTRKGFEPALEFLQRGDVQGWLNHPAPEHLPPADYMDPQQVAATALAAAADKRFFHWELEFPEVFFAPSKPGGQDVQLREEGFDAVVGNPPWEKIDSAASEKNYLSNAFQAVCEGEINFYTLFLYSVTRFIARFDHENSSGKLGLVIPNTWMINKYDTKLRQTLLRTILLDEVTYMCKGVFPDAPDTIPVIVMAHLMQSMPPQIPATSTQSSSSLWHLKIQILDPELRESSDFMKRPLVISSCEQSLWCQRPYSQMSVYDNTMNRPVLTKLDSQARQFVSYYSASDGIYKSTVETHRHPRMLHPDDKPVIESAEQVGRYELDWYGSYIGKALWQSHVQLHSGAKLVLHAARKPTMQRRLVAAYSDAELYFSNRFIILKSSAKQDEYSPLFTLGLLNSSALNFYFRMRFPVTDIDAYMLHQLPIPIVSNAVSTQRLDQVSRLEELYRGDLGRNLISILELSRHNWDNGETGVLHHFLAFLAEQMIDLNKRKQAEVKRFLTWLEGRLAIIPKNGAAGIDSLTGKSILQNYLGDYQKGEPERTWDEFYYRLHQNRTRFHTVLGDVKGEVEREYAASLAALRPLKQQLRATDTLIDKIVYQLYGLTDAEIEIIERPQYEQALAEAKQAVVGDKTLSDEQRANALADKTLAAAQRLQERVNLSVDEAALAAALPGVEWITGEARTFLLGAEFDLRTRPEQLDFSPVVTGYTKAVEQMLGERLFARFRAAGATAADCRNEYFQKYMNGGSPPSLAAIGIILRSSKETALRRFAERVYLDAPARIFGENGVAGLLDNATAVELRNRAAHDTVLTREDGLQMREWALKILRLL